MNWICLSSLVSFCFIDMCLKRNKNFFVELVTVTWLLLSFRLKWCRAADVSSGLLFSAEWKVSWNCWIWLPSCAQHLHATCERYGKISEGRCYSMVSIAFQTQLWHCLIIICLTSETHPNWAEVSLLCLQVLLSLNSFSSNCWIHRPSMAPFSLSCYTTAATLPPILLNGDCRDCGAALLPWQQALSHFPHINRAVCHHQTGGLRGSVGAVYIYIYIY